MTEIIVRVEEIVSLSFVRGRILDWTVDFGKNNFNKRIFEKL